MFEMPVVTNLQQTHGIVPLPGGKSLCVRVQRTGGILRTVEAVKLLTDRGARRWLRLQGDD